MYSPKLLLLNVIMENVIMNKRNFPQQIKKNYI